MKIKQVQIGIKNETIDQIKDLTVYLKDKNVANIIARSINFTHFITEKILREKCEIHIVYPDESIDCIKKY
jgi:hypothetical protein